MNYKIVDCSYIGVMGSASISDELYAQVSEIGALLAIKGYTVLSGGRNYGVMDAISIGASRANGTVIGILPGPNKAQMSTGVTIPILTGMGSGRNIINVLSSDVVVVVVGDSPGTISELALAVKSQKPLVLYKGNPHIISLLNENVYLANTVRELIDKICEICR